MRILNAIKRKMQKWHKAWNVFYIKEIYFKLIISSYRPNQWNKSSSEYPNVEKTSNLMKKFRSLRVECLFDFSDSNMDWNYNNNLLFLLNVFSMRNAEVFYFIHFSPAEIQFLHRIIQSSKLRIWNISKTFTKRC